MPGFLQKDRCDPMCNAVNAYFDEWMLKMK